MRRAIAGLLTVTTLIAVAAIALDKPDPVFDEEWEEIRVWIARATNPRQIVGGFS
jgi:hypothetical protein